MAFRQPKPITDAEIVLGMAHNALLAAARIITGGAHDGDHAVVEDALHEVGRVRDEMKKERGA